MRETAGDQLVGLRTVIAEALHGAGVDARTAASSASRTVLRWCANFGGTTVYLPRGQAERLAERDAEIAREFDGTNATDLARRFGLSESRVRQIIRRRRRTAQQWSGAK